MQAHQRRLVYVMHPLVTLACGEDVSSLPPSSSAAISTYGQIVHATYSDALTAARNLDQSVSAFLADPSPSGLEGARQSWRNAREPYLLSEVFRFYDGPIDNPDTGPEGLMNAWPLDEAYIDYVEGNSTAGIIQDPSVEISASVLESLNESGGEENIATGYHAIEFLLWGQDQNVDGPGDRPFADYVGTATATRRRAQYLATVSGMLVGHLEGVTSAWSSGISNYRSTMESGDPREGLRRILTGLIVLSGFETGGERLQTALDSGDQEDEHSCFSDNTHRDMIQDIQGMKNVWSGQYGAIDGTGLEAVVRELDSALAMELGAKIDASLALANALVPPFDREIAFDNAAGRARVQALVVSLREQERLLERVFTDLELSVPVVAP